MRIAILHYSAPPVVGGVETIIRAHTALLLAAGHTVTILAGRGKTFDRRAPVQSIPLLDSVHPDILTVGAELAEGIVSPAFDKLRSAILCQLREHLAGMDVILAHNALTLHKNLPLTAALWELASDPSGSCIVAWCHDLAWANSQYLPALHEGEPWNLLQRQAPNIRYVAVSQDRVAQLAALWGVGSRPALHIPNGIDALQFLRLSPTTRNLASRLGLWQHDVVLLLPARLTRRKNIEFAIRVTASLVARGIAAGLVVTGPPGPHNVANVRYVQELDELRRSLGVTRHVHLLHLERNAAGRRWRISDRVVADLYALSDALLFPSMQEGFGLPLLEAGLARLPVFCSDIPPLRALAGNDGHLFPLDSSPHAVADMIEGWLHSDGACRLRRRVLASYTWQAVYGRHIEPLLSQLEQERSEQTAALEVR